MGRLDMMIEHERGYKRKQSLKPLGMIDYSKIEKERERKRYDPISKASEKKIPKKTRSPSTSDEDDNVENEMETEMYKDYDLYLAAKNGDLHHFKTILDRLSTAASVDVILSRLSPVGNTFLHVAAKHGNLEIVDFIASVKPSFVLAKNFSGETALHLVARDGDESMVKALVQIQRDSVVHNAGDDDDRNILLKVKNERGNTALHEALYNNHTSIAEYLIGEVPELSYQRNNNMCSPLYLAAKIGSVDCVSLILRLCTDEARLGDLFKKRSPIEVAIKRKNRGVLDAIIFNTNSRLIEMRDGEGRNPLHFAASLGHLEEARYLLSKYAQNSNRKDKNGILPIHLASFEGHVDIITLLLKVSPDPSELLDWNGCNILHVAAKGGRYNVFKFVRENPHLHGLVNMKDKSGNMPLHWASYHFHNKIVTTLLWKFSSSINEANSNGMSALDIAEYYMSYNPQFRQRLTWAALKAAGVRRYSYKKDGSRSKRYDTDYKERVNTLLIMATLVATVTFAAGFTMPGGYISSDSLSAEPDSDMGMATMLREKGFHVFVFCDTLAMYSSIIVATTLIWAQLGDLKLALIALTVAVPLLGTMMSVAFTAGIVIVVSKLRWLSRTIYIGDGYSFCGYSVSAPPSLLSSHFKEQDSSIPLLLVLPLLPAHAYYWLLTTTFISYYGLRLIGDGLVCNCIVLVQCMKPLNDNENYII